jgi:tricorn protease
MPRFLRRVCICALLCPCLAQAAEPPTRLLRQPALSQDHLAFVYGGDIWVSDRDGAHPLRLTTHPASEFAPHFSPDGKWLAFSANYDNNTDVYVVPVEGGQPRRLTWHPSADVVSGWSADGQRVLFVSNREVANSRSGQFYEVPLIGGYERRVMKAVALEGRWSPDGKRLAYRPYLMAYAGTSGWRQHRGGDTPPIWIIDAAGKVLEKIPHVNASDSNPLWVGEDVVFISDRNDGSANLFVYDSHSHAVRQLTHEQPWDVRSADAYGNTVVYEAGGELKSLDLASGQARALPIHLSIQSLQARPQWKDAVKNISSAWLSPSGKRVLVTARGDVFSVPVKDGSVRNLTATSGVREADALWSRDGQKIAYLSDAGGTQALLIRDARGLETATRHTLGESGYFRLREWSPDAKRLVFQDNHLHLYAIELASDKVTLIDTSQRRGVPETAFSPDGQWLAYTVVGANFFTRVKLYSFASGTSVELADSYIQTDDPVFSSDGDLLYFTASIDAGPTRAGLDMTTRERPLRKGIYAAVLAADGKSPLAPKTGDEPAKAAHDEDTDKAESAEHGDKGEGPGQHDEDTAKPAGSAAGKKDGKAAGADKPAGKADKPPKPTRIDLAGLSQRFVPIPVAERNYDELMVASDGALLYLARAQAGASLEPPGPGRGADAELFRYSFKDRAEKSLRQRLVDVSTSADRKKLLLIVAEGKMEVADANEKLESKPLELSGLRLFVDPRQEWRQIFEETWRMEQQFFYAANLHGLDWQAIRARYEPLLPFVQRREDLNDLLIEMIGELQVGHNRLSGGDLEEERPDATGLLGADFKVENNLYRIQKIYRGDIWNPYQVSPLTASGVNAAEGDAILAINGRPLDGTINIFALLENTVDKQVSLTLSRDGSRNSARTVTVIPIDNDRALRQWDWVQHNRDYVERRSGGKVAYVYLPDTADEGFTFFNRMFFAQTDRDALIVDDRRNSGGQAANYVLEVLSRRQISGWKDRDGLVFNTPAAAIYGPKVMLIDQDAGSGGDYLPWGFRHLGLGKLIGTRTWGGLIGIAANPPLIDGARLTVPFFRFYTPEGEWHVENEGVAPDLEVQLDPLAVNEGRDPQLDAAIDEVLEELKSSPPGARKSAPPLPTQLGK